MEIGTVNAVILVTISLTLFESPLASIRKRKAAVWIWKVTVGRKSDSMIMIRSYVPISLWVRYPVRMGSVMNEASLGRKVPIDNMSVFFANLPSRLI